jgi:meiotic recombination protein SPO11
MSKKSKTEGTLKAARDLLQIKLNELIDEKKIELPDDVVKIDNLNRKEALSNLYKIIVSLIEQIQQSGRPVLSIPSRQSKNIIWDEENDLLLLGEQISSKPFHSLTSYKDFTRLIRILEIIHELLKKDLHATKREAFYNDVKLFEEQANSDKGIEDASTLLRTTRNSTHIVASAKGSCIGRLRIRDKTDIIDLEGLGSGGWTISPYLDNIEILESDAEFILVVEKDAAMGRLAEDRFWRKYPCIILTGKGAADMATRMFLKQIYKELRLPVFCLVDSDPYGHYIYSVYLRGSKRLSYESPFLATPDMKLLGVLSRDLDNYNIPKNCRLPLTKQDIKRTKEMLKEDFVKINGEWVKDLELMLKTNVKAEIQALSSHGFEFLTEKYLPEKLTTGDWL